MHSAGRKTPPYKAMAGVSLPLTSQFAISEIGKGGTGFRSGQEMLLYDQTKELVLFSVVPTNTRRTGYSHYYKRCVELVTGYLATVGTIPRSAEDLFKDTWPPHIEHQHGQKRRRGTLGERAPIQQKEETMSTEPTFAAEETAQAQGAMEEAEGEGEGGEEATTREKKPRMNEAEEESSQATLTQEYRFLVDRGRIELVQRDMSWQLYVCNSKDKVLVWAFLESVYENSMNPCRMLPIMCLNESPRSWMMKRLQHIENLADYMEPGRHMRLFHPKVTFCSPSYNVSTAWDEVPSVFFESRSIERPIDNREAFFVSYFFHLCWGTVFPKTLKIGDTNLLALCIDPTGAIVKTISSLEGSFLATLGNESAIGRYRKGLELVTPTAGNRDILAQFEDVLTAVQTLEYDATEGCFTVPIVYTHPTTGKVIRMGKNGKIKWTNVTNPASVTLDTVAVMKALMITKDVMEMKVVKMLAASQEKTVEKYLYGLAGRACDYEAFQQMLGRRSTEVMVAGQLNVKALATLVDEVLVKQQYAGETIVNTLNGIDIVYTRKGTDSIFAAVTPIVPNNLQGYMKAINDPEVAHLLHVAGSPPVSLAFSSHAQKALPYEEELIKATDGQLKPYFRLLREWEKLPDALRWELEMAFSKGGWRPICVPHEFHSLPHLIHTCSSNDDAHTNFFKYMSLLESNPLQLPLIYWVEGGTDVQHMLLKRSGTWTVYVSSTAGITSPSTKGVFTEEQSLTANVRHSSAYSLLGTALAQDRQLMGYVMAEVHREKTKAPHEYKSLVAEAQKHLYSFAEFYYWVDIMEDGVCLYEGAAGDANVTQSIVEHIISTQTWHPEKRETMSLASHVRKNMKHLSLLELDEGSNGMVFLEKTPVASIFTNPQEKVSLHTAMLYEYWLASKMGEVGIMLLPWPEKGEGGGKARGGGSVERTLVTMVYTESLFSCSLLPRILYTSKMHEPLPDIPYPVCELHEKLLWWVAGNVNFTSEVLRHVVESHKAAVLKFGGAQNKTLSINPQTHSNQGVLQESIGRDRLQSKIIKCAFINTTVCICVEPQQYFWELMSLRN